MNILPVVYVLAVNLTAFFLYGADKRRAKQGKWRISERTLLGIAAIGGSVGALFGMHVFRHKTRHWYFRYGIPVILMIQLLLIWLFFRLR